LTLVFGDIRVINIFARYYLLLTRAIDETEVGPKCEARPTIRPAAAYDNRCKGKAAHLYSALHGIQTILKRLGMDHTV